MSILRACLNWRVLAALGAVGVGIFLVAPGIAAAALPLLLLAACPLSMLLMMKAMGGEHEASSEGTAAPLAGDRVAALRSDLVELNRRQERLARELAAVEAAQAAEPQPSPTPVTSARQPR